jgi:hypothetical protein
MAYMGSKKTASIVLIVGGIVVLLLSLLADVIGIGGNAGLGPVQILGIIVGIATAIAGLILLFRK